MEAIGEFDHTDSEGFLRVLAVGARSLASGGQIAITSLGARPAVRQIQLPEGKDYSVWVRIADALPGGMSRTNYLLAARSLSLQHPSLIDGITFGMNGFEDAYAIEGSDIAVYDAENESWITESVIDLNGSSPNCVWQRDDRRCG